MTTNNTKGLHTFTIKATNSCNSTSRLTSILHLLNRTHLRQTLYYCKGKRVQRKWIT